MRSYANETMTCINRYAGENLVINGNAFNYAVYRNGTESQLYITVHWLQESTTAVFQNMLRCRVGSITYNFSELDGWADPVCVVPYRTDGIKYALIPKNSSDRLVYNYSATQNHYFSPEQYTTLPGLVVKDVTLLGNYSHALQWTLTTGNNRLGWVCGMEVWYRDPGADTYETLEIFTDTFCTYYTLMTDSSIVGKEACVMLEYRTYTRDWDGEDKEAFTTLNRLVTPWQLVERDANVPPQPASIAVSMLLAGGWVTVQWPAVTDPITPVSVYWLERSVNGTGSFIRVFSGSALQFRDLLPADTETVEYRVCAVSSAGQGSSWTATGVREVSQSNLYVCSGGRWMRASGVWIGEKRASPMAKVQ